MSEAAKVIERLRVGLPDGLCKPSHGCNAADICLCSALEERIETDREAAALIESLLAPPAGDAVERVAMKLAMFMFDTWGDAEGVVWNGLTNSEKDKARKAAIAALPRPTVGGEVERLRGALKQIEGGNFPNASTLAIEGRWHELFTEMQKIARAALTENR